MDPIVSARVPAEIREQGNRILADKGSSPTALINSAYLYLIETGELPRATALPSHGSRRLDNAHRKQLLQSIQGTTRAVPEGFFTVRTDDEILEDELRAAYETLA